jgi:hypothetical protein
MVTAGLPASVWIRPEDLGHPKLDRVRRAVNVDAGPDNDVTRPWITWGIGLSRSWLATMLEAGGHVLVLPPWPESGFAGLPPVRNNEPPAKLLLLNGQTYTVGAALAFEPSPAWQEHGLFVDSKLAWLVSHEPFVGSGRAWLCAAELLTTGPATRPRDARQLTHDVVLLLAACCKSTRPAASGPTDTVPGITSGFGRDDGPYLLAVLGLAGPVTAEDVARFVHRRLGIEPDLATAQRVIEDTEIQSELLQPVGRRPRVAGIVDGLGFRSYRVEIEEAGV